MTCPDGGEHSLEQDQTGGTSMLICTKCGTIIDHSTIMERDTFGTSYAPPSQGQNAELSRKLRCNISDVKKPAKGLQYAISAIKEIGNLLNLSENIIEDALNLFKSVYNEPVILKKEIRNKIILAACCVYIKCRENSIPVTMKQISEMVQTLPSLFGHFLSDILKIKGIQLPPFDFGQFILSFCGKLGLSERVIKRTVDMVPFLDITGNLTGYCYQNIVIAMAFLAWQADDVPKNGKAVLSKFSDRNDLKKLKEYSSVSIKVHVKNLRENFKKLAAELPWVTAEKLDNVKVLNHVDDVLRYKRTLYAKHLGKCTEIEESEECEVSDGSECLSSVGADSDMPDPSTNPVPISGGKSTPLPDKACDSGKGHSGQNLQLSYMYSVVQPVKKTCQEQKPDIAMYKSDPSDTLAKGATHSNEVVVNSENRAENVCTGSSSGTYSNNISMNSEIKDSGENLWTLAATASAVHQTQEDDIILSFPPGPSLVEPSEANADHEIVVLPAVNDALPLSSDAVESVDAKEKMIDSQFDCDQSLHAENLARVKRKYSRLIAPRSFKKARIRDAENRGVPEPPVDSSTSRHTCDSDDLMSDSELEVYLRTEGEIKSLETLKKKGLIDIE